jgi:hypothetical protein
VLVTATDHAPTGKSLLHRASASPSKKRLLPAVQTWRSSGNAVSLEEPAQRAGELIPAGRQTLPGIFLLGEIG